VSAWRDARVLVTGARGFIGAALCRRLVAEGASVVGVSAASSPAEIPGVRWARMNIRNQREWRVLWADAAPDVAFHLGGHVSGSQDLASVLPTFHANLESTVALLTVASEAVHARVILAGSMHEPASDHPTAPPCSPYAAAKWAATGYARMFQALYGVSVAVARPMMVYGPGQWDTTKVLPYVTTSLLSGVSPALGTGTRELDWVFIEDVVEGLLRVGEHRVSELVDLDLGTGILTTVRAVAERVATILQSDVPLRFGAVRDRLLEQPRLANVDATRARIGWVATTALADGLDRTVSWYKARAVDRLPA
jgi:UDP-glucose 4-epimerase